MQSSYHNWKKGKTLLLIVQRGDGIYLHPRNWIVTVWAGRESILGFGGHLGGARYGVRPAVNTPVISLPFKKPPL